MRGARRAARRSGLWSLAAFALLASARPASADENASERAVAQDARDAPPPPPPFHDGMVAEVEQLEVHGLHRTLRSTVTSLLPRQAPTTFTFAELEEFERRLNNLAIFDSVTVRPEGKRLIVEVREKWTLIPSVALSTGKTFADTFIELGLTEYNFLGSGDQLGGALSWEQRGPNGIVSWYQHPYRPGAGAWFAEAFLATSSLRFDSGDSWYRQQTGGQFGWKVPYFYATPLRVKLGGYAYHEQSDDAVGPVIPASGVTVGTMLSLSYDRYTWRDLAPSGYELSATLWTGAFIPHAEARHQGTLRAVFAVAFTNTTVLVGQVTGDIDNGGNANHSLLVGSVKGVRGLDDAFYRNREQVVGNLEFRQAWRFAKRWALQGVVFVDEALFRQIDARGDVLGVTNALSVGAGARLIPTFLAGALLRVDAARLITPEQRWLPQFGFSQYF